MDSYGPTNVATANRPPGSASGPVGAGTYAVIGVGSSRYSTGNSAPAGPLGGAPARSTAANRRPYASSKNAANDSSATSPVTVNAGVVGTFRSVTASRVTTAGSDSRESIVSRICA